MSFYKKLTQLGLSAASCKDLDLGKFERLHRPVGKIKLYRLTDQVNEAMELYGYTERVSDDKFRSLYTKEMLEVPLEKFCRGTKFQPRNKKVFDRAVKAVAKKFCKGLTTPISIEESYQLLMQDKSDHFAGLPTLGKKEDDLEAVMRAKQVWHGKCPPPPIIGHRGKNTEVVRAVWMFPFEEHIVEGCFYFPLYEVVKRQSIYPVGPISERRYVMRKYCQCENYNTKFSIDYSGFDASINSHLIGVAFDILTTMLKLDADQRKVWERVRTYFATSPFLAPDGMVYKGRRGGVPSGSMFTQMVDSICNAITIEYSMMMENQKDYRYLVYGDDSWTIVHITEAPQQFLQRFEKHVRSLGLTMNVTKTAYAKPDEPIVFCGHYDIMRGRPIQDAIDKLCFPERPSKELCTREGICERLIAYMADADLPALNAVFLANYYRVPLSAVSAPTNLNVALDKGVKSPRNRRNLPGILQVLQLAPKEASSYMKIRSAI